MTGVMTDLLFLAIVVAFFALAVLAVRGCALLLEADASDAEQR